MHAISVTPAAAAHIQKMLDRRGSGVGMRLRVENSGCSGKKYVVELIDEQDKHPDDKVYFLDNSATLILCVDPVSYAYVAGTQIDYEHKNLKGQFVYHNPNEKAACGCGESFYVE